MKFLSVCSGIEAASVAWSPLGFEAVAFSEVDKFPSAVLAHHYPSIPNLGDMLKFKEWPDYDFDILVGGTPCQSFSVAGLRKGLADPRGNLMLTYLAIADRYKPEWIVWENVPGVLSSGRGRDFGTFLGALAALGYGWAYRVLDAQFFGVPQRRRRVFVVGHLGNWQRAASVLFEQHSLQGHSPPSREKREGPTYPVAPCIGASGRGFERTGDTRGNDAVVATYSAEIAHATTHQAKGGDPTTDNYVAHSLRAEGFDASEDGTGRGTPLVPVGYMPSRSFGADGGIDSRYAERPICDALHTKSGGGNKAPLIAFSSKDYGADAGETSPTLRAMGHADSHPNAGGQVAIAFNHQENRSFVASSSTNPLRVNQTEAIAVALRGREGGSTAELSDVPSALRASGGGDKAHVMVASPITASYGKQLDSSDTSKGPPNLIQSVMQVRRLTPRCCERLQGFLDDYTLIPVKKVNRSRLLSPRQYSYREIDGEVWQLAADGPRYKALGNSFAVPVVSWIGKRIQLVNWLYS